MKRGDIIRMAREASEFGNSDELTGDAIERFAAAEREKLASWMIGRGFATGHGDTTEDLLAELEWQIEKRLVGARGEKE
jgi:hypothetical protein